MRIISDDEGALVVLITLPPYCEAACVRLEVHLADPPSEPSVRATKGRALKGGRTPLHYAALENDVVRVADLLARGADPNAADENEFTPLHFAAQESALEAAEMLLHNGATVDAANVHGNTPLLEAVSSSRGKGELIQLLRGKGADPFHRNRSGQTPVGLARLIANYDVARFFADLPDD